jgi:hypothetical protein
MPGNVAVADIEAESARADADSVCILGGRGIGVAVAHVSDEPQVAAAVGGALAHAAASAAPAIDIDNQHPPERARTNNIPRKPGTRAGVTKALAQLAGIEPDRLGLVGQDDVGHETETEQVAIEAEGAFDVGDDDRDVVVAHLRLAFDFERVQMRQTMRLVLLARSSDRSRRSPIPGSGSSARSNDWTVAILGLTTSPTSKWTGS